MYRKEMISAIISHKDNLREDELKHHGILGQKWGVRRYQNTDGSYTAEGRERYGIGDSKKSSESKEGGAEKRKTISKKDFDKVVSYVTEKRYDADYEEVCKKLGSKELLNEMTDYAKKQDSIAQKVETELKDFTGDQQYKYAAMAALINYYPGKYQEASVADVGSYIRWYTTDDGDQGEYNSISLYASDKGIYDSIVKSTDEFNNNAAEISKKTKDQIIKNYPVKNAKDAETLSTYMEWNAANRVLNKHENSSWALYAVSESDKASKKCYQIPKESRS